MSYQPIWDGRSNYGGKRRRAPRRLLLGLLLLAAVVFAALEGWIALHSGGVSQPDPQPQVMVIFGCQVKPDGPSVLLQDRLDAALDYLAGRPDMKIVLTGGQGKDEPQSEARCMYDYLTAHGVAGENIYLDERARNTWQNVNYAQAVMEENGMDPALCRPLLVSSAFHLARVEMLWERAAPESLAPAALAAPASHWPSAVKMFFREPLALAKSLVFDR